MSSFFGTHLTCFNQLVECRCLWFPVRSFLADYRNLSRLGSFAKRRLDYLVLPLGSFPRFVV